MAWSARLALLVAVALFLASAGLVQAQPATKVVTLRVEGMT